jgi:hypothetical protein
MARRRELAANSSTAPAPNNASWTRPVNFVPTSSRLPRHGVARLPPRACTCASQPNTVIVHSDATTVSAYPLASCASVTGLAAASMATVSAVRRRARHR